MTWTINNQLHFGIGSERTHYHLMECGRTLLGLPHSCPEWALLGLFHNTWKRNWTYKYGHDTRPFKRTNLLKWFILIAESQRLTHVVTGNSPCLWSLVWPSQTQCHPQFESIHKTSPQNWVWVRLPWNWISVQKIHRILLCQGLI
jgi:hypothetical protein